MVQGMGEGGAVELSSSGSQMPAPLLSGELLQGLAPALVSICKWADTNTPTSEGAGCIQGEGRSWQSLTSGLGSMVASEVMTQAGNCWGPQAEAGCWEDGWRCLVLGRGESVEVEAV